MRTSDSATTRTQGTCPAHLLILLALVALPWLLTLGNRALLEPDEARYAEIPREMLTSGDWLTPRLNDIKYFEKPALQYWMTALAFKTLGQHEFAARLWTGLTGLAGIVFLWFAVGRLYDPRTAQAAALILASSLLYVVVGHLNTLDMGLVFFLEVSVFSFLLAQHAPTGSRAERHWMWLASAAAGLAFLSKGLVALLLPGLGLIAYTAISRDLRPWQRLHMGMGTVIFLAIGAPWIVLVSLHNPEFPNFFFVHEHFARFLTREHDRYEPWWYFLPVLLAGALPWTSVLLSGLRQHWQAAEENPFTTRFLVVWVAVVMVFFSLSNSKLPPYIAPVLPALAVLTAHTLRRASVRQLRWHFGVLATVIGLLALTISLLPDNIAGARSVDVVQDLRPYLAGALLIIALSMAIAIWLLPRTDWLRAMTVLSAGTLAGMSLIVVGSDALSRTRSNRDLAMQLAPQLHPDTTLYSLRDYPQSLPFYLNRTLIPVAYRGELDFGLQQEPERALTDIDAFLRAWAYDAQPIAVLRPETYQELQQRGVAMRIIAQQKRFLAITRP